MNLSPRLYAVVTDLMMLLLLGLLAAASFDEKDGPDDGLGVFNPVRTVQALRVNCPIPVFVDNVPPNSNHILIERTRQSDHFNVTVVFLPTFETGMLSLGGTSTCSAAIAEEVSALPVGLGNGSWAGSGAKPKEFEVTKTEVRSNGALAGAP